MTLITAPCIIDGMSDSDYHSDPVEGGSLSSSGAKTILRSPAHYIWERANRVDKTTYDVGHAVHSVVLGVGAEVVQLDYDSWRTKESQAAKEDAYANGQTPILTKDYEPIAAMSESVLAHPIARSLFEAEGKPEQSMFAQDPESGVWLRARADYLPDAGQGQTIIVDLKTSISADPRDFAKSAATYGYDIQSENYQQVLSLARGDADTSFRFIVVEKSAPYLVSVIELDAEFAMIGRARMRRAIDIFKRCREADEWGGYEEISHLIGAPRWLAFEEDLVL